MSDDAYGGAVGAFPYAFRASDSVLFRLYVVLGAVLSALSIVFFALGLAFWVAQTLGQSPVAALSRAFLILIWLAVVAPVIAPVLLVARRHRRNRAVDPRYDAALAITGLLYVLAVYVALLIAAPADARGTPTGAVAPLVEALYAMPRWVGAAPPLAVVALMGLVHRVLGRSPTGSDVDGQSGGDVDDRPEDAAE